jgi:hypothetical protein
MKLATAFLLTLTQLTAAASQRYFPVNWPVGDGVWKETPTYVVEGTGIDRYKLIDLGPEEAYRYKLEFSIDHGWCWTWKGRGYYFTDGAKPSDTYQLTCHKDGNHYVRFNSEDPTIILVGLDV